LLAFCRKMRVTSLSVGSYACRNGASIPPLPGEISRRMRREYFLDLTIPDLRKNLHTNHRYSVKQAEKAGLQLRVTTDPEACAIHCVLMEQSMARRESRGEDVPAKIDPRPLLAYLRGGAGTLFQAVLDGKVFSSLLVLLSEKGAYNQTAGTSPEGMACGASPFLIFSTALALKERGIQCFSLGGADEASKGLQRFKAAFGSVEVKLPAAVAFLGSRARRRLLGAARRIRQDPLHCYRMFVHLESYVVYSSDPSAIIPPNPLEGITFRKLSDEELAALTGEEEELKRHATRFRETKFNDAYAAFCNGKLAHISWLITPDHDRLLPVRDLRLRDGEAEITHCLTLPQFRRRGLYPYVIRNLCQIAASRGTKRLFMITNIKNIASQHGMAKAGLLRHSRIFRLVFSLGSWETWVTLRGHRITRALASQHSAPNST